MVTVCFIFTWMTTQVNVFIHFFLFLGLRDEAQKKWIRIGGCWNPDTRAKIKNLTPARKFSPQKIYINPFFWRATVDGWSPEPVDRVNLPVITFSSVLAIPTALPDLVHGRAACLLACYPNFYSRSIRLPCSAYTVYAEMRSSHTNEEWQNDMIEWWTKGWNLATKISCYVSLIVSSKSRFYHGETS